ncbi:MAG TPA: hypothetical protein VL334_20950 [Anaerolineae bacterium]|nr:hypothetical protein [Anaerolineae bacterium]
MLKTSLQALMLIALLLLAVAPAAAQGNSPVTATLSAPAGQLTVGDPIQLTLALTHPAGYQVILPALPDPWGDFTVAGLSPATATANADGSETTTLLIDARLFQPGDFNTPALEVSVTDGQGGLQTVMAAPATISIASVLPEGDTELRDIKPQAALPLPAMWPWIAAGLAAVAAVTVLMWWARRRQKVAVDNRQAHEVALDGLTIIKGLRLPEQGRFKEHYTLVSDTVRVYVERRYRVPALERTTGEIRPDLARTDLSPEVTALLLAFLQESDLVKFSEWTPDVESAQQLLARARMIVEATKPEPPVQEPGPSGQPPAKGKRRAMSNRQTSLEVTA